MKKSLTISIVFTTLFLCIASGFPHYAQAGQKTSGTPQPLILSEGDFSDMHKSGTSTVSEVINPMTIMLEDKRIITLAGLDFPDLDFYNPGDLSVTAQKVLDDFLTGEKVAVYQTSKSDQGRINRMGYHIAHLVRINDGALKGNQNKKGKDVWVQGLMLSLGLARVRTTKYNRDMAAQMLALEDIARKQKDGLWNMSDYILLTPEQAKAHIGSYQLIEGVVKGITMHKNKTYINFGHNWRKDFTLGISGSNARTFRREHIEPREWNGATMRVRGWIESFNGPYIELDHPERVEILSSTQPIKSKSSEENENTPITQKGTALPAYNQ
ncbi:MAG: thermonuclease family protein [Alphaproteobacteria bacterium]|nr:thermonuclease family protein [Alphaproteobacteria bacterium]